MANTQFDPLATPVDFILLAGKRSPGIAEVEGASTPRQWDERAGYGLAGAYLVGGGRKLAHFSVTLRLYTSEDWADWHNWMPLVEREPFGKRPRALDIWHPWLEMLGIKSVVVEDVEQPKPIDNGGQSITIKFIENRRPKLSLAKPVASDEKPSNDPVDKLITKLTDQLQREELGGQPTPLLKKSTNVL